MPPPVGWGWYQHCWGFLSAFVSLDCSSYLLPGRKNKVLFHLVCYSETPDCIFSVFFPPIIFMLLEIKKGLCLLVCFDGISESVGLKNVDLLVV